MKSKDSQDKTEKNKRFEFQDLLTKFIYELDSSGFLLEEIENHCDISKIDNDNFQILKELMQSSRDLSLTILKELHIKTNKKGKK